MLAIVKVDYHGSRTHVFLGSLDAAVDFADWLMAAGCPVEITEGHPLAHPHTPAEQELADALVLAYANAPR